MARAGGRPNEYAASAGLRARTLLCGEGSGGGNAESLTGDAAIGPEDEQRVARRIELTTSVSPSTSAALANSIVSGARDALARLKAGEAIDESAAFMLESVIYVRGRPSLRVLGTRLEDLGAYPGSERWQEFITSHELRMGAAAAAVGAVLAVDVNSHYPVWLQGSAWLVRADRVVTNRHVLQPDGIDLVLPTGGPTERVLRRGVQVAIDFARDHRDPCDTVTRRVTKVLYLAEDTDPVDIAVLEIEPYGIGKPLPLDTRIKPPSNLMVIGHPAPVTRLADAVKAVFGNPDGRKRLSFGMTLPYQAASEFAHDASTIGGFSGAPVLGISSGGVTGLHYYGDPESGNLAISCIAIRQHPAWACMGIGT